MKTMKGMKIYGKKPAKTSKARKSMTDAERKKALRAHTEKLKRLIKR